MEPTLPPFGGAYLKHKMSHEYRIQWITVKLVWDFLYAKCVSSLRRSCKTELWKTNIAHNVNSNLQHGRVATNPDAQRKDAEDARKRKRSPTRSCSQLLFRERKNKVTSARWVATYFSKPKNRGHPPKRALKTTQQEKPNTSKHWALLKAKPTYTP